MAPMGLPRPTDPPARPGVGSPFACLVVLDYVSCSPYRVQMARIGAGPAALNGAHGVASSD